MATNLVMHDRKQASRRLGQPASQPNDEPDSRVVCTNRRVLPTLRRSHPLEDGDSGYEACDENRKY